MRGELDRLRAVAAQYSLTVDDPDAAEMEEDDLSNGSGHVSDQESASQQQTAAGPAAAAADGGSQELMQSWAAGGQPQLSLTPQAVAQRKYRSKLKVCCWG